MKCIERVEVEPMIESATVTRLGTPPRLVRLVPGILLAASIGAVAVGIENLERLVLGQPLIEALVAAIIVGIIIRNAIRLPDAVDRGATFAAKQVLEAAVFLLGVTIDLHQVVAAGPILLAAIAVGVIGGIAASYAIGRILGLHTKLALLVAVGNSICGNSAIAAVAPVIRADKKDVASSIALTAVVGIVLILSLPLIIPIAHLTHYQYGVIAGMTVYAVPQVIAASFPVSQLSGQVATLVKLVRVLFLGPVVLSFGLLHRLRGEAGGSATRRSSLVPWFVIGFLALAALRFIGATPAPVVGAAARTSQLLMILAMAGLGLGVDFGALKKVGPRVATAVAGSLAFLIALSLTLVLGLRITG